MNLNGSSFRHKAIPLLILSLIVTLVVLVTQNLKYRKQEARFLIENDTKVLGTVNKIPDEFAGDNKIPHHLKEIQHEETAPDQLKKIVMYEAVFDPNFYHNYYTDYFLNKIIIAVIDLKTNQERYLFTGEERTGYPHWLGNSHIFFTTYCGTACKGIYLGNVDNREILLGVWGYTFSEDKKQWQTHFTDWFGGEFDFEGLVHEVASEVSGNDVHFIFKMEDDQGNFLGEKRFLFTGEELREL